MAGEREPDAVLNLRTLEVTLHDDGRLVIDDGDQRVELLPCGGGPSPEAAGGLERLIHEAGYAWELTVQALRRQVDQADRQG